MSTGGEPLHDPQWDWVRAAARAPTTTPAGLIERVLRSVHGVRGRQQAAPLDIPQDGGTLHVGERALVLLARRLGSDLGERIGGLHVSAVAMEDGALEVVLTVKYGVGADVAAERMRAGLHSALQAQFGAAAPVVNVHVADVH